MDRGDRSVAAGHQVCDLIRSPTPVRVQGAVDADHASTATRSQGNLQGALRPLVVLLLDDHAFQERRHRLWARDGGVNPPCDDRRHVVVQTCPNPHAPDRGGSDDDSRCRMTSDDGNLIREPFLLVHADNIRVGRRCRPGHGIRRPHELDEARQRHAALLLGGKMPPKLDASVVAARDKSVGDIAVRIRRARSRGDFGHVDRTHWTVVRAIAVARDRRPNEPAWRWERVEQCRVDDVSGPETPECAGWVQSRHANAGRDTVYAFQRCCSDKGVGMAQTAKPPSRLTDLTST